MWAWKQFCSWNIYRSSFIVEQYCVFCLLMAFLSVVNRLIFADNRDITRKQLIKKLCHKMSVIDAVLWNVINHCVLASNVWNSSACCLPFLQEKVTNSWMPPTALVYRSVGSSSFCCCLDMKRENMKILSLYEARNSIRVQTKWRAHFLAE